MSLLGLLSHWDGDLHACLTLAHESLKESGLSVVGLVSPIARGVHYTE